MDGGPLKTYRDDNATRTASATMIKPHAQASQLVTGWRRGVALFALCSWILSAIACPMPDVEVGVEMGDVRSHDEVAQLIGAHHPHGHEHGHGYRQTQDSTAPDLCCQILGQTHAIAQPLTSPLPDAASPPTILLMCAVIGSVDEPIRSTALQIPRANGPPRSLYLRFAQFWSNAPPLLSV